MKLQYRLGGFFMLLLGLSLMASCNETVASRGKFDTGSCAVGKRVAVTAGAAYAIYVDESGNPVGNIAEDLKGTQENQMCPTDPPSGGGACPTGSCPKTISGKTYCLHC